MKTISITVSNRPNYLEQCLNSLYNVEGIDDYTVIFGIEPLCEKSFSLCDNSRFKKKIIYKNTQKLGIRDNPYILLNNVFQNSMVNIYLEEDVIVSPDIIYLSDFYYKKYKDYILLNLFNKSSCATESAHKIFKVTNGFVKNEEVIFSPFSWITTQKNWNNCLKNWWYENDCGWDFSLSSKLSESKKEFLVVGKTRSNHIGEVGTHVQPDYNKQHFSDIVICSNKQKIFYDVSSYNRS